MRGAPAPPATASSQSLLSASDGLVFLPFTPHARPVAGREIDFDLPWEIDLKISRLVIQTSGFPPGYQEQEEPPSRHIGKDECPGGALSELRFLCRWPNVHVNWERGKRHAAPGSLGLASPCPCL